MAAPKKKKVIDPLERDLNSVEQCYSRAKTHLMFDKEGRTFGKFLSYFGLEVVDKYWDRPLELKQLPLIKDALVLILKEKYQVRKHRTIPEHNEVWLVKHEEPAKSIDLEILEEESIEQKPESTFVAKYPDQSVDLLVRQCNQVKAAMSLFDNLSLKELRGQLLLAQTGAGKTYILASIIKNFIEQGLIQKHGCMSPWPIMYITKSSIVEQTEYVLREEFGIDTRRIVSVINIEYLRTKLGSIFVNEEVIIKEGQEHYQYKWKPLIHPVLCIWDECQILARAGLAKQAKIAESVNDIENLYGSKVFQIFASATPFARVSEAKVFAVSTRTKFHLGLGDVTINNENWKQFAAQVASPAAPEEYVEAAVERLTKHLEPYIVRIKGIRPKYKAYNSVRKIRFRNKEEKEQYDKAWDKHLEAKAKAEGNDSLNASQIRMQILASFTIFRKSAEAIRAPYLAEFAHKSWLAGKAPVIVAAFKGTITAIVRILIEKYGWSRDDISLIWGGATEALSAKKKTAKKLKENEDLIKAAMEAGIDFSADLGIDLDFEEKTEEQLAFEKLHRLSSQNPKEREAEKLRFQRQDSRLCILTYKAGGVGLSLHHEAKYPNARPREVTLTPVYSEKELVQGLGRAPRITSISDTFQVMCYYYGTIEEQVASRVVMKLKCLKKVVGGHKESWEDFITGKKYIEDVKETLDAVDEAISDSDQGGNELMEYNEEKDDETDTSA